MNGFRLRFLSFIIVLFIPGSIITGTVPQKGTNLVVGSCNVRCLSQKDDMQGDGWDDRKQWLCSFIEFMSPDILGAQEVTYKQKKDMVAALPEYDCIGVGRNDGKTKGEHALVFYRRDRFKLLRHGDFWLSESPDQPSTGWDAAHPRICTWGCLKDKVTHKKIWIFNLHNDHRGVVARRESAKLVISRIKEMTGPRDRVFVTGDFNVDQRNEIYTIYTDYLEDSYMTAEKKYAPNGSFNAFRTDSFTESRIDHIFVTPGTRVLRYGLFTETYRTTNEESEETLTSSHFPSEVSFHKYTARTLTDHFPIFIKVRL